MFRFNLKSAMCGLAFASLAVSLSGCSSTHGESASAPQSVQVAPTHQANNDPNRNPFQPSKMFNGDYPGAHAYATCNDGVSLRLMDKWLRIPHDGTLADKCLSFDEAVPLVQRELPRLKASIDDNNRQVDAKWAALRVKIRAVANQSNPLSAANQLLDMECGAKGSSRPELMDGSFYQWTLFLDANPVTVRAAAAQIYALDYNGYGDKLPFRSNTGVDEEKVYDDYTYDAAMKNGPTNHINPSEGNYWLKVYGQTGTPEATRLIEAYYEANRVLSNADNMPGGFSNGNAGYVCQFR